MKLPAAFVALTALALAATVWRGAASAVPVPTSTPWPAGSGAPMAYYLMKGNVIISQPYGNPDACAKDLYKLKQTLAPGTDTVVCAHRRP